MSFFYSFNRLLLLLCLQAYQNRAAPAAECIPYVQGVITNTGSTNNNGLVACAMVYVFDNITFSSGSSRLIAGNSTLLPGGPPAIISRHTFSLGPSADSVAVDGILTPLSPQTTSRSPAPGYTISAGSPSSTVILPTYTVSEFSLTGNRTSIVSGNNTLTPGATPVTFSSHTLSIPSSATGVTGRKISVDGILTNLPTRSLASSQTQSVPLTSHGVTLGYEVLGVTSTDTVPPANLSTQLVTSNFTSNTWLTTTAGGRETIVPVLVGCAHCGGTGRGVIVWNYPPTPKVTFQFPKLPNGDIVDPFHLPCIPIPLIQSCTSPPVDDTPVDGAAGGVDPDPKSPDPRTPTLTFSSNPSSRMSQSSTSSSTASSTSSRQLCSFSCSECANNDPPSSYPPPSKAKKRVPSHPGKTSLTYEDSSKIRKRVLPEPGDAPWYGHLYSFLYDQIEIAEEAQNEVALRGRGGRGASSALAIELRALSLNMVVQGMYGCTSVIVVSQGLVWGSHFWEDESFESGYDKFKATVMDVLGPGDGTAGMPGLSQYTHSGGRLAPATDPQVFIITPGATIESDGNGIVVPGPMFYPNQIGNMTDRLTEILGQNALVKPIVYAPEEQPDEPDSDDGSDEDVDWTPKGRFLFQYNPNQMRCNGVQTAMWKLWVEGELRERGSWTATNDQLIARRKRQEIGTTVSAVCPVSGNGSASSATSASSASSAPSVSSASIINSAPSTNLAPSASSAASTSLASSTGSAPSTSLASSTSSAPSTSSASPSGSTFAIYLALKVYEQEVTEPNGFTPGNFLVYYDEVWETAGDSKPDYCDPPTRSTMVSGKAPSTDKPCPTATITSLQPSGTSGPTCNWIPSPSDSKPVGPGHLSCNGNPTSSVACASADAPMTTCLGSDTRIYPAAQCVWLGG